MVSFNFINEVLVLSLWIIIAWQYISPEVTVKGFRGAVCPMEWMGLIMMCCGMTVKRMGMASVSE